MADGFTPALQSSDDDQIRLELGTVLLALHRLRVDIASGRIQRNGQLLSAQQIDELLGSLRPPARHSRASTQQAPQFQCTADSASVAKRSTRNWNALAEAVD